MRPHDERTEAVDAEAHDAHLEDERVSSRAHLLPEEQSAGGSDDPEAQAKIILEDSARRTDEPDAAPTTFVEHRTSEQAK